MAQDLTIVRAKMVVSGPHGVGKTSLITRHETKTFTPTSSTVGASFSTFEAVYEDLKVKIQIWDTAGQERFRSMAPLFYRGANAALFVFDLTSSESLENLEHWVTELRAVSDCGKVVLGVAGNKSDLESERQVTRRQGKEFAAKLQAAYFETSALDSSGVEELFEYFSAEIGRRLKEEDSFFSHVLCSNDNPLEVSDKNKPAASNSKKCCQK